MHEDKGVRTWESGDVATCWTEDEWNAHLARMERCRLSDCTPDCHRCLDDEGEWGTFDGPEAA